MTLEEIWRRKSDEELLAASRQLADYTEVGQRVIVAELDRRRGLGEISETEFGDEPPVVDDSTGASQGTIDVPRGYFQRLWRGYVPLPITFWLWGTVGHLLWNFLITIAAAHKAVTLMFFLGGFGLAYYGFICVAIWRSAGRYRGRRLWSELARISLAAGVAKTVVTVFFSR